MTRIPHFPKAGHSARAGPKQINEGALGEPPAARAKAGAETTQTTRDMAGDRGAPSR